jgi:hypothetical protein
VIVLGAVFAYPALAGRPDDRPTARTGEVGMMEAMMNARQPAWIALLNPVIGVVGVWIGARLKGPEGPAVPNPPGD